MSDSGQNDSKEKAVIGHRVIRNRDTGEVVSGLSPIYAEDFPFSGFHADQPLLRYMDLWKFEDLLKTGELNFYRADKFDDPLEGTLSKKGVQGTSASDIAFHREPLSDEEYEKASSYREIAKACTFVNCWHMNHDQCLKMWEVYSTSPESVLVITTAGRLLQSLKQRVFASPVKYVSEDTPRTEFTARSLFFYKDAKFAFEKLRASRARTWDASNLESFQGCVSLTPET